MLEKPAIVQGVFLCLELEVKVFFFPAAKLLQTGLISCVEMDFTVRTDPAAKLLVLPSTSPGEEQSWALLSGPGIDL